jgi:lysozyme
MQTSENGIKFIKANEGYAVKPYNDNGKQCWGYGHDQQNGEPVPPMISLDQADLLLRQDLASRYEPTVNAFVPPDCTQNQFDALVDFCFNLGVGSLRMMVAHGWDNIPFQIFRWNHVNGVENAGLTARRSAEVALFIS